MRKCIKQLNHVLRDKHVFKNLKTRRQYTFKATLQKRDIEDKVASAIYMVEKRQWYENVRRTNRNVCRAKIIDWYSVYRTKRGRPRRPQRKEVDEASERRKLQDKVQQERNKWRQQMRVERK